jgi:hypothetical protein
MTNSILHIVSYFYGITESITSGYLIINQRTILCSSSELDSNIDSNTATRYSFILRKKTGELFDNQLIINEKIYTGGSQIISFSTQKKLILLFPTLNQYIIYIRSIYNTYCLSVKKINKRIIFEKKKEDKSWRFFFFNLASKYFLTREKGCDKL